MHATLFSTLSHLDTFHPFSHGRSAHGTTRTPRHPPRHAQTALSCTVALIPSVVPTCLLIVLPIHLSSSELHPPWLLWLLCALVLVVVAMSSAAGSSRFLAYLEQRRSLTASQSTGIAKQLRDYEAGKADMQQASISRTQPSTPTAAAMASAPHSITPLLLRSQSLTAVSLPSAAYTTGCAPSPIDTADEEHKETIISSSSTVSTASSSASSDLSPLAPLAATLPSSTPSSLSSAYPLAPASSLLHRELVDLRLRLQRTEDEHMTERKRWEQQRAAERREAEEWKRRAEEKREREEEWEDERGRLRAERDEWSSERLVMQQELDRLNVYFQQLSSTSPTAAASSSSSLSSALSIVAVAKDREENNRLRRKNNRLIDTVNQKQTECDTLLTQLAQLTQWKQQHEQQSTEHTKERTRLQQQHEQLTSEVARLRRAESEWQQRQAEKKELERAPTAVRREGEQVQAARGGVQAEYRATDTAGCRS